MQWILRLASFARKWNDSRPHVSHPTLCQWPNNLVHERTHLLVDVDAFLDTLPELPPEGLRMLEHYECELERMSSGQIRTPIEMGLPHSNLTRYYADADRRAQQTYVNTRYRTPTPADIFTEYWLLMEHEDALTLWGSLALLGAHERAAKIILRIKDIRWCTGFEAFGNYSFHFWPLFSTARLDAGPPEGLFLSYALLANWNSQTQKGGSFVIELGAFLDSLLHFTYSTRTLSYHFSLGLYLSGTTPGTLLNGSLYTTPLGHALAHMDSELIEQLLQLISKDAPMRSLHWHPGKDLLRAFDGAIYLKKLPLPQAQENLSAFTHWLFTKHQWHQHPDFNRIQSSHMGGTHEALAKEIIFSRREATELGSLLCPATADHLPNETASSL